MGRKKAYKPAALRRAVQEYFAALRYREPVYREEPVLDDDGQPEFDRYGHPATRFVRVVTEDGTPASRTSWVSPPTITGLCGRLGISRQTWSKYLAAEETHDICDEAKRVIETYLQERLEDKTPQRAQNLRCRQTTIGASGGRSAPTRRREPRSRAAR